MKKLLTTLLLAVLTIVSPVLAQNPLSVADPAGTVITVNPGGFTPTIICGSGGGDIIGEPNNSGINGTIFRYTNASWNPYGNSPCTLFGVDYTLSQIIDANRNAPVCDPAAMDNMTYNSGLSNLANGILVYTGTTQYTYRSFGVNRTEVVNTRCTISFTDAGAATTVQAYDDGTRLYIPVAANFDMRVYIEAQSPSINLADNGCAGGQMAGGIYYGAIELFDRMANPTPAGSYIICTSFSAGSFYESTVTALASNTGPVAPGGSVDLNSSETAGAAGALTYSWSGPGSYGTQNVTINPAGPADNGLYTVIITDLFGCQNSATTNLIVSADTDGDGIDDVSDNCVTVFNPAQTDVDGDGYGAACDCNDNNAAINPGATEVDCNGIDDDCNALTVEVPAPALQTVVPLDQEICPNTSANIQINGSQVGIDYFLRDDSDNSVVDGPLPGTGSPVIFNTGNLAATTDFNVMASGGLSGALDFDGIDDGVFVSDAVLNNTTEGTIEAWVNLDALNAEPIFAKQHDGVNTYAAFNIGTYSGPGGTPVVGTPGVLYFHAANGTGFIAGSTPLTTGNWHHVAVSFNSTSASLYIDGSLDATTAGNFSIPNDLACTYTAISTWYGDYLDGRVDEVRIWGVAKSQSEIASNLYTCLIGNEANLNAYYKFEDGTGGVLDDATANTFDGTLSNMNTTSAWVTGVNVCSSCETQMSAVVTVTVDATAPIAVCQDITVVLDATGNATIVAADIDGGSTDFCPTTLSIPNALGSDQFDCTTVGTNIVTLTVTDDNGNTATCDATVTVEDNEFPTVTCNNVTVVLDGSGNGSITTDDIGGLTAADNCGIASVSASTTSFTCANVGANTITLTVTDDNSNVTTCDAIVTVEDNTLPNAICQPATVVLDAAGNGSVAVVNIDNGSNDNCGIASMSLDNTNFTCANIGANTVVLTVTDDNANVSTCSSTVTVQDNIDPIATCQNITVQLDVFGVGVITPAQIDNGSNDACGIANLALDNTIFGCGNVGANTVELTVTDNNGNTSTCNATVTVEDNVAPAAICQPVTVQLDASGNGSILVSDINNGSNDACGILSLALDVTTFDCSNVGSNTVILTVTDNNTNVSTCSAIVTVEDNIDPTAICQDVTIQLDPAGMASITTGDIDNGSNDICGIASLVLDQSNFSCADVGSNTVVLTVTDNNGNTSTCSANVTVQDTQAPMVVCPSDITLNAVTNNCGRIVTYNMVAVDNCSFTTTQTDGAGYTSGDLFPVGTTPQSYEITDQFGNTTLCSFNVTIVDNQNPSITGCPANITANTQSGICQSTVSWIQPTASDNCPGVVFTSSHAPGSVFPLGTTTVTYTATDASGNTNTCSFNVTVQDNEAPIFVDCPSDIAISNDPGVCEAATLLGSPTVTDNCTLVSVVPSFTGPFPVGTTVVTWTATDNSGNTSTCIQNVNVTDDENPIAVCTPITIQLDAAGNATITANDIDGGSSDNCSIATLTTSQTAFDCSHVGANTVTLTVEDIYGNSSSCDATVTVEDNVDPIAICQNITAQLDATGNVTITAAQIDNGSNDACGIAGLSLDITTFDCSNIGANAVVLTVTDNNGNSSTCNATVTVEDNVAPAAICQNIAIQLDAAGNASIVATDIDGGSTDACGILSYSADITNFTCADIGANSVVLTVTDLYSNASTCTSTVTVEDNVAPVADCQDITVQLDATGNVSIAGSDVNGVSTDACGPLTFTVVPNSFTCAEVGVNTVVLTVTDGSGNTSTCNADVTVEDNVAPVVNCSDITVQLDASGNATIVPGDVVPNMPAGYILDQTGTFAPSAAAGTNVFLGDDAVSGALPVGFNFDFYGNTYTQFYLSSNGFLSFDPAVSQGCCQGGVIPTNDAVNNVIAFDWDDLYPPGGGSLLYQTIGTAPNRQLIVSIVNMPLFPNSTPDVTSQVVLYETSNIIEIHTTQVTSDGSNQTMGIENANGTDGLTVPGRNSALWTASNDYVAFIPVPASGVSDACGIASTSVDISTFDCSNVGPNTVTVTATDVNGNSSTCTSTVTVEDNIAPIAICQDVTVQLDAAGSASIVSTDIDNGSNDACGIASVTVSPSTFNCDDLGANIVTLTVTDNNGNVSTCTATVTVEDNIAPIITCPGDIAVTNDPGVCEAIVTFTEPTVTDNCSISPNLIINGGGESNDFTGWTITNNSGNGWIPSGAYGESHSGTSAFTGSFSWNVKNQVVDLVSNGFPAAYLDGSPDIFVSEWYKASACCSPTDEYFFNAELLDASMTVIANYNLGSQGAPVASTNVWQNVTNTFSGYPSGVRFVRITHGSKDTEFWAGHYGTLIDDTELRLTGLPFTQTAGLPSGSAYPVGTTTNTFEVTDEAGNTSTCSFDVTVTDSEAPIAVCNTITVQLDATGNASITVADIDGGSTDNCGIATTSIDVTSFDCLNVGANAVVLTVEDIYGNVSTCTSTVTVEDNVAPVAMCQDITVQLDATGNATITTGDIDNGSSDACGIASLALDITSFDCSNVGSNTVILTVTDNNTNVSTCSSTVMVEDNVAPVANCQDITVQLDATGNATITTGDIDNGSNDACGIASLSLDITNFDCSDIGANTVVLTVTDNNGNSTTCSSTVTVEDIEAPIITCPSDVLVSNDPGVCTASSVAIGMATATDNCTASVTIVNDAPAVFPFGNTTVTWTATDASGNSSTCAQTVTVEDVENPIITCPAPVVVSTNVGTCNATGVVLGTPITSDNCTIASVVNNAPATFPLGVTNVTWTVTDVQGNTATCAQTVTVQDTEVPVITCPADITVGTNPGVCAASGVALGSPTTSDNCTIASVTNNAPGVFALGNTTVTWTVTDAAGNTATCNQIITVVDNVNPTIACAADITVNSTPGICGATGVTLTAPITNDNCMVASVSNDAPVTFPLGDTDVTWTVTDAAGNTAECIQVVTVIDAEAPMITCPTAVTASADAGSCSATGVVLGLPVTSDNCNVASTTNNAPVAFPLGNTTVIWTVTDDAGNTATCSQTVTVTDDEAPIIVCPSDLTVSANGGTCSATMVAIGTPMVTDNCAMGTVTNNAPGTYPLGNTTVTWTATDAAGNTSTCEQIVTVIDTEAPAIACPSDVIVSADAGSCDATGVVLGTPVTSDNCTVSSVTNDAPAAFPLGTTTVIWTVTDAAGNMSTCTQMVTVNDNEAPIITCPADLIVSADAGSCNATSVVLGTPVTSDNCSIASVTNNAPGIYPLGNTTVTWTIVDGSGNSATCTQVVTVEDNELPTITCPSDVTITADAGVCGSTVVVLGSPVTADNCSIASTGNDAPAFFPVGTTTVTWIVTDGSGNTATCTQDVTVTDDELPVIVSCAADMTVSSDPGSCNATGVVLTPPSATDNCSVASITNNAPAVFGAGTTTVTWTVTDPSGNSTTCSQVITVVDGEAPVITCPTNITANNTPGFCGASVTYGTPVVSDNCGIAGLSQTDVSGYTSGNLFPIGSTTQEYTVVDISGNTSVCSFTVTVIDAEAPMITSCPADMTIFTSLPNQCEVKVDWSQPQASDNCPGTVMSQDYFSGDYFPFGTTTVTYVATDNAGNTSVCSFNITVVDMVNPTVSFDTDGVTLVADNAGTSYQWIDCSTGNNVPGAIGATFTPSSNGSYAVIINDNGCIDTSSCQTVSSVGIEDITFEDLVVYPNPSMTGIFKIKYSGEIKQVEMFDMLGRVIMLPVDLDEKVIDGTELASGKYMLRLFTDHGVTVTEVIINR